MQELPFHTITQLAALGLTLVAGWFLGLASSSGGRKWRERYQDLDLDHAGYRDRAETDLREAGRRIRELEAENARLNRALEAESAAPAAVVPADAPVAEREVVVEREGHSTVALAGAAVAGAVAGAAVTHAAQERHEPAEPVAPEPVSAEPEPAAHAEAPAPAEPAPHVETETPAAPVAAAPADTLHVADRASPAYPAPAAAEAPAAAAPREDAHHH
jgi:hypothetical protein